MSVEQRDSGRGDASAPWERPGRWAHQRMDATTVDDLIARLASTDAPGESRRQRREAGEAADTDAVPAGELIAALSQTESTAPEPSSASESRTDWDAPAEPAPDAAAGATAQPAPVPAAPDAPATVRDSAADLQRTEADPPTEVSHPSGTDHPGAEGPADVDGISHTAPIPVVSAAVETTGAERDSILASLRRELGGDPTAATAAASAAGGAVPPRRGRTTQAGPRRHQTWWVAGRVAVAMLAVFVVLVTGTEWVIKHRADQVLADNRVSAIVPDDTNISTPTLAGPTDQTGTGTATAQPGAVPAGNKTYQAENILLMGSDARLTAADAALGNAKVGEDQTMQSDVLMIAHLSADRKHVTVLSLPRDLYVKAPTCKAWDYSTNTLSDKDYVSPYTVWKITNAFSVGGPQCTVKAVQELTGLKIDRVIIIDFSGFKDMVDALGGITVNICRPIIDGQLGTVIAKGGVQEINGTQALSLVRARKVEGDPTGDIGRIRRQQVVLSTILRQVTNAGVLLNPGRLDSLLQAFVRNTQTDNVTLDDLIQLAQSLGNLSPSRVTFYTLPTVLDPDGQGQDATDVAPAVFSALVNDQPLPGEVTEPTPSTTSSSATPTPPAPGDSSSPQTASSQTSEVPQLITVAPGSVDLQVVNVTGRRGVATAAMASLNSLGFAITDQDLLLPEGQVQNDITVQYDPANQAAALTVAAAVPGAELVPTSGLGNQVRLMLGSSFDGTVQAVSLGQLVTGSLAASSTGDSAGSSTSTTEVASSDTSTTARTTSSPSKTLTTDELSAINAASSGCI